MTVRRNVNPLYLRAGVLPDLPSSEDVSDWVLGETEKAVRQGIRRPLARFTRLIAAASLALCLGLGAMTAVGTTYAAWSDLDTYGNRAGAGVWTIDVAIDVINTINPDSDGRTQVKIFGTESFDLSRIDIDSLCFGSTANPALRSCNVVQSSGPNGPGFMTVMVHFNTNETGIQLGDTTAVLTGKTFDGWNIFGIDEIRTAPHAPSPASTLRLAPAPLPTGGEELLLAPEPAVDVVPEPEPEPEPVTDVVPEPVTDVVSEPKTEATPEPEPDPEPELDPQPTATQPAPLDVIDGGEEGPATEVPVDEPRPEPADTKDGADETVAAPDSIDGDDGAVHEPVVVPGLVDLTVQQATRQMLVTAGVPDEQIAAAIEDVDSVAAATELLEELCGGLLCAGVSFEQKQTDAHEPGTILEQSRPADAEWAEGDTLTLVVAVPPPPPPPPPPPLPSPPADLESTGEPAPAQPEAEPLAEGLEDTEANGALVEETATQDDSTAEGQP